ncbi:hypothetical protein [Pedobacter sp.]|uniref:hypothetical protein n=1 Tax=Pedobacter sp. TaxID=1411316 RepID=UPI003D7FAFF3
METIKIELVIENTTNGLSGRIKYNDNLIVDHGDTLPELEENLKKLLNEFENLDPENVKFEHFYDVYAMFKQFDFLKIAKVAAHAGIDAELLNQYANQLKYPNAEQAKKLENTIHELARQMIRASIYV